MRNTCPTCMQPAVYQCRCLRSDSACANGHHWHWCLVHNCQVIGESDHAKPGCSCNGSRTDTKGGAS